MIRLLVLALLLTEYTPCAAQGALSMGFGRVLTGIEITDSTITVFWKSSSMTTYAVVGCDPCSPPDEIWKEVYKVKSKKIVLDTTIRAEVRRNPSQTIIWPESK